MIESHAWRIGTRGSPLAMVQAREVERRLRAAWPDLAISLVPIATTGDRLRSARLAEAGGKGLFVKEIEEALLDRRVDIAVHSLKDVPTALPDGLVIGCVLPREDPRDVLIAGPARSIAALARAARVGTSSPRRQAQLLALRPDLDVVMLRGNVGTRLDKLAAGQVDATLLALAGLKRLGRGDVGTALSTDEMLPAVAQGAIGIEHRADDARAARLVAPLNDPPSAIAVRSERGVLERLDGSCRTPIAALATLAGDRVRLSALVARQDGREVLRTTREGAIGDALALGREAGDELRRRAGAGYFG
jgi:hydroxymethylbilane synthase